MLIGEVSLKIKRFMVIVQVLSLINFSLWSHPIFADLVGTPTLTTNTTTGEITSKETHQFDKVSDSDMLASITMLAGGFIAGRMIASYRPITADVGVAGAAGAAFVAGELMSNFKFKGTMKSMEVDVIKTNTGTIDEEQIQRLADLKKSYIEAKSAVSTKKKMQLAAAAGFGIAAVMAQFFTSAEEEALRGCQMALTQGNALLTSCPSPNQIIDRPLCTACKAQLASIQTQIPSLEATRQSIGISSTQKQAEMQVSQSTFLTSLQAACPEGTASPIVASVATRVKLACTALLTTEKANQTSGDAAEAKASTSIFNNHEAPTQLMSSFKILWPVLIAKMLLVSDSYAGWIPLLGLSAATAASFYLINGKMANEIDRYMFIPRYRAIAFAGLGALSYMASRSSDNVIKKINQNINQIDQILDSLSRLQNGVKVKAIMEKAINLQSIPISLSDFEKFSQDGSVKMPCLVGAGTNGGNCPSLENKVKELPDFVNLPESIKTAALQATKMGDGLSGAKGISGDLLGKIDALGAKQAAISNLFKKNQSKKRSLDPKKKLPDTRKFLKGLELANAAVIKKSGQTPAGMLAGIGGVPIDSKGVDLAKPDDQLPANTPMQGRDAIALGIGEGNKKKDKDQDFELNLAGDETNSSKTAANEVENKKDEFEVEIGDINKEDGASLFELISNRYLISGYPKLLEEVPASKN